jgi:hypothetical protein
MSGPFTDWVSVVRDVSGSILNIIALCKLFGWIFQPTRRPVHGWRMERGTPDRSNNNPS